MNVTIRQYREGDLPQMLEIWNEIVEDGIAFPQTEQLSLAAGTRFFSEKAWIGVAEEEETGKLLGLYILHPNNVGRCGHIANATYGVRSTARGLGAGEALVRHSIEKGRELGFRLLQFNAVVKTNYGAIHLYEKLGFVKIGLVPGGFFMKDGTFEDIILFYRNL